MPHVPCRFAVLGLLPLLLGIPLSRAQSFETLETEHLKLIRYSPSHGFIAPHLARCFENSLQFHRTLFDYTPSEPIVMLLHDFGDFGHGGTSTVPWNFIAIGIEPFDYVYETVPANERMNWLMHHELVHVVATDKAAGTDRAFRKFFGGKVSPNVENPLSMFYSYLTSPRWYSPRWYHEGIAVFMETWMAGGMGRVLGGYDEMAFRTMVLEDRYFFDTVGLESEGTTADFQVGQNSYLYGTRFVTYLAFQYGPEKLIQWFNRTDDSRMYFSQQFRRVYGMPLETAWRQWIEWEHDWQRKNLQLIREYPVTEYRDLVNHTLGSVSRSYFDPQHRKLYVAVNYPANPAQIVEISVDSGQIRKLCEVTAPALYFVTSLAYDAPSRKLFYTSDNTRGWRDLNQVDVETGQSRTLLKDVRTGDLVVNPSDHSLWGIQHHQGISSLVRFPVPYDHWETVATLPYGKDIFDLDISPDGGRLSASYLEVDGSQLLVLMDIEKLLQGDSTYEPLHQFESGTPANFVFSRDGRYLLGTSYYTGVSNVFRFDFERREMEVLTNAQSGFFRPEPFSEDELIVFRYGGEGFMPALIRTEVRTDLNAVNYLGQQVVEKYPVLTSWNAGSPAKVDLESRIVYSGEYAPFKRLGFASWYPVVEGYKDTAAVGARFSFADPVGLNTLDVTASYSPDSSLPTSERFHLTGKFDRFPWSVSFAQNGADFYDLFGPTKASRKGTAAKLQYGNFLILERPRTLEYTLEVAGYAGLDRLPDYQNIGPPIDRFMSTAARLKYENLRRTIGAVDFEKGTEWSLALHSYLSRDGAFPRFYGNFGKGFLLPIDHSSIWIRGSAGQAFGERENPFSNFYFGGFGNNWVDYLSVKRFREYYSFPGVEIDEIGGRNFGKLQAEWSLPPIRFRRVGFPAFYANWAQFSVFSSGIVTDLGESAYRREFADIGVQMDLKLVIFSSLESTLSLGYARAGERDGPPGDEFMASLKLLH